MLPPSTEKVDAGNYWAGMAAVRARQIDHDMIHALFRKAQIWHDDQFRHIRAILRYLADLNLQHSIHTQQVKDQESAAQFHDPSQDWGTLYRLQEKFVVTHSPQTFQPDIHPAILIACLWGNQYADLVRKFCAALIWPDSSSTELSDTAKLGITWHEVTIAFVVNTGLQFPTWIRLKEGQRARPHHWQDPAVLALPKSKRSLREQSEAFRSIALYLQGFTETPLLPKHSKVGSQSLTRVGWGRTYTGLYRWFCPSTADTQCSCGSTDIAKIRRRSWLQTPIPSRWFAPYAVCAPNLSC